MKKQGSTTKKRSALIAGALLVLIVLIFAGLGFSYMRWEKPPAIAEKQQVVSVSPSPAVSSSPKQTSSPEISSAPVTPAPSPTPEPIPEAVAPVNLRQDGVYTVLLVGEDKWTENTDTILVGKIDTVAHKMDFVSIPRDTLLNIDWEVRKINCVYYRSKAADKDPAAELKARVREVIGFDVDCYAVINLQAFIDVIDALGGVEFDVPQDIYFEDYTLVDGEWQDSYHGIYAGKQRLNGFQCMGLVRYRHGYVNGDLGRIQVQHDFLRACAQQFITLGNIPNLGKVIQILSNSMDTDLTAGNIAYFLRQALLCKPENINFHTVPSTPKMIGDYSYAVILVYQWRDMINEVLNPYREPLDLSDLNVMYNDYFGFGCTQEVRGAWYYVGAAEAEQQAYYNHFG